MRARHGQAAYCGSFIGVTGSTGKTTTTLLVERLLLATGASVAGGRGANHDRYLMKTMARLRRPTDFVVQEVSGHQPGAIADITSHLVVQVAVVTTIGYDHSRAYNVPYAAAPDAIAAEKGKLVEAVAPGGFACLNADDARVAAMASRARCRVVTFGTGEAAEVRALNVSARWPDRLQFDLVVGMEVHRVVTRFLGTIMLPNVLAALAVVHGAGRALAPAVLALASTEPEPEHMSVLEAASGRTYVLDTFKASLWLTWKLADDLANISGDALFVLGDLAEIRGKSGDEYRKLARALAGRTARVILVGRAAEYGSRLPAEVPNLQVAANLDEAAAQIARSPHRLVILKSNRSLRLQDVVPLAERVAYDHY